jgi:choline dehydrogenase-like flavoprotein
MHHIMDGKRPNLHIMLDTWVDHLVFERGRIIGVECTPKNGQRRTVHTRHEVLLCAGAVDSPRLLLLSGIGPCKQLVDLGIPMKHDLPGVGENLQVTIRAVSKTSSNSGFNDHYNGTGSSRIHYYVGN